MYQPWFPHVPVFLQLDAEDLFRTFATFIGFIAYAKRLLFLGMHAENDFAPSNQQSVQVTKT